MAGFGPVAVLPVASLPVASSTAAPFNPAENSAPIAAIVRRLDQQQRALTQTGGGAKPIGQSEQPFQVLGIVRRQDFTAAHNLVLGSDRFPPGQSGVGPEYDWANPRLAVRFTPEGSAWVPRSSVSECSAPWAL